MCLSVVPCTLCLFPFYCFLCVNMVLGEQPVCPPLPAAQPFTGKISALLFLHPYDIKPPLQLKMEII